MITPPHRTVLGTSHQTAPSSTRGGGSLAGGLRSAIAALATSALLSAACADPSDPTTLGSLSGMVRDAATHAPLGGVSLSVADRHGRTAADGRYTIDRIPAGIHQVSAEMEGYAPGSIDAEIRPGIDNFYDLELTSREPGGGELRVTTSALPQATVGAPYEASLAATGGVPPYAWSWGSQGPPGLLLDARGKVMGTPGYPAGTYRVRLSIQDADGTSAWRDVTLEIVAAGGLRVGLELRQGEAGEPYADTVRATGGRPPYTFQWSAPSELEGLVLEAATGALSGTPIRPTGPDGEPVTARVTVHDAAGASAIGDVALGVRPAPLVIVTESLPDGVVGDPYEAPLEARGGYGLRAWTVTAGIFPPGLSLYSDESLFGSRVQGTPTVAGSFTFTLSASDGRSQVTREYTVEIVEPAIQGLGSGTRSGASSTK